MHIRGIYLSPSLKLFFESTEINKLKILKNPILLMHFYTVQTSTGFARGDKRYCSKQEKAQPDPRVTQVQASFGKGERAFPPLTPRCKLNRDAVQKSVFGAMSVIILPPQVTAERLLRATPL